MHGNMETYIPLILLSCLLDIFPMTLEYFPDNILVHVLKAEILKNWEISIKRTII